MSILEQLKNQITTLGREISQASNALATMAMDQTVPMDKVTAAQENLTQLNARMSALKSAYAVENDKAAGVLVPLSDHEARQERTLADMLKSNEYNRAFAFAMVNGITRKTGRGNEKLTILYDALTESGGDPKGTDGGFLVPEDLDFTIREQRQTLQPLADLFSVETVTAPTGWRIIDTQPTQGFTKIDGEIKSIPVGEQPAFQRVGYTTDKYALRLPVSNELVSDSIVNLYAYLGKWAAKKQVITENTLLIAALQTLETANLDLATDGIKAVKKILNVTLDPAYSKLAGFLMNQNVYQAMDELEDKNGRGLLQPDPTNATGDRIFGRNVTEVSNITLPGNDLFVGYLPEFATLFMRQNMEMAATDIGGDAWETDSTEFRFITRLGVTKFDDKAAVRRTLTGVGA